MPRSRWSSKPVVAASALLGILATGLVIAQQLPQPGSRRGQPTPNTANIGTEALLPDLVADYQGTIVVEQFTAENPCSPHSHTMTGTLQLRGRFSPAFPTVSIAVQRNGQQLDSWTISTAGRDPPIKLGAFTWTSDHPCPGSGTSIGPDFPHNTRLVVDAAGAIPEVSEQNNAFELYVRAEASWARAQ